MAKTLDSIPNCDNKVFSKGEHIATIINIKPSEIEEIVKLSAKRSKQKIDWHYFGGRAVVKTLGNVEKARSYLKHTLEEYNCQSYRFTTENDSVLPWPLK